MCEYCEKEKPILDFEKGKVYMEATICDGDLTIEIACDEFNRFPYARINYCPMCGKKLEHKEDN